MGGSSPSQRHLQLEEQYFIDLFNDLNFPMDLLNEYLSKRNSTFNHLTASKTKQNRKNDSSA